MLGGRGPGCCPSQEPSSSPPHGTPALVQKRSQAQARGPGCPAVHTRPHVHPPSLLSHAGLPPPQKARKEGKEQPAIYPGHCLTCLRVVQGYKQSLSHVASVYDVGEVAQLIQAQLLCPPPGGLRPGPALLLVHPLSAGRPGGSGGCAPSSSPDSHPPGPAPPSCTWTRAPARTSLDTSAKMPSCQTRATRRCQMTISQSGCEQSAQTK